MRVPRLAVFLLSGLVIVVALFFAYLKFLFWEPDGVERGSLVYHLKIPGFAKNYPIWNASNMPAYDLFNPDGLAPGVVKISYRSTAGSQELISDLKRQSYKCRYSAYGYVRCDKSINYDLSYSVELKKVNTGTDVIVKITGGY